MNEASLLLLIELCDCEWCTEHLYKDYPNTIELKTENGESKHAYGKYVNSLKMDINTEYDRGS